MKASVFNRKLHRVGAILIALPLLIVIGSGLLLQLKKESDWVQPPSQKGTGLPTIPFEQVLDVTRGIDAANVSGWNDIDRLDVRPGRGLIKVRCKNRTEVQLDASTGAVLQVAERRSDVIESLHDGSFFHDRAKLWIFLPSGVILLGLWFTGIYLFFLPTLSRRRRDRRRQTARNS